ncbi:DUF3488 and transglutaminase-like domain-containing protein [Rhabdothermincola salaria]|uniref:DUF3488 and transglutaminase-like domain-containing protein n=1 Tax=Rhabdothermincola salaria TaxID=2903142 RepID=UPI001E61B0B7|nr:DUF3488 and transglutaminase-like domain-containing protein [Rhabdothermincola salaria]MCD9622461.1 DUF3488 and transglutaminase-like domain-containing protein [Rhabdothermincola salaria]
MTITSPPPPPPDGPAPAPALEPPPDARADRFGGTRPARPARRGADRPPHLLGAEVALGALTAAGVYGFARIFDSFDFLWPLLVIAGAVHVLSAVLRRRGVGIALSFLAVAAAWVLVATWLFFRETTFALVPTPSTLDAARLELDRSWSAFSELVAPAPVLTGFVVAAALAVGVGAFLADWAAFRLWSSRDAVVPSLTLFVFATLLAGGRQRVASAVVYVAAALVFALLHRVVRLERSNGWVTSERATGGRALLGVGVVIVAMALVAGVLLGPRLPGADSDAIVDWRGLQEDDGRVTVSPLVDIRSRLVQRSESEVFQVSSPVPAYWRMTALDDFDGVIWRSSGTYDRVQNRLPVPSFPSRSVEQVDQEFRIQSLSTLWLPAAAVPVGVSADLPVSYQAETSTLIVDPDLADADGASYTVESLVPTWSAEQLQRADPALPDSVGDALDLPEDFPEVASATAREVVAAAGATTRYEQVLALQDFFRTSGGFTYDLEVDSGHSGNAIVAFLENRRGYCEQFAGTFAAMARSLGIPARVAVGFTWGDELGTDEAEGTTTFQVRGRNAHAWPEVYLGEYGWVPFEPTPGRGAPNAEAYTGQSASQVAPATGGTEPTPPEGAEGEPAPPVTPETPDSLPGEEAGDVLNSEGAAGADTTSGRGGAGTLALAVVLLLAAAAGYLALVPGRRALTQRRRRHAAHGDPSAEIRVTWREVADDLALARLSPRPGETHAETASRVSAALPDQAAALHRLADAADTAAYAPNGPDQALADAARADAGEVRACVAERLPRWRRWLAALDPRLGADRAPRRHHVDRPHG